MQASNEIEVREPARQRHAGRGRGRADGMSRRWRAGVAAAMLMGAVTLVAACGGGSGGSSASGSGSGSSGSSQNNPAKFAQCMRSQGVPSFPDPTSNGQFALRVTKGGSLDPNSATFQSAVQACRKYDSGFGSSGNGSGAGGNQLQFANCMRSHGVSNFPDPQSNGGLIVNGNVRSNPHFQSAQQACRHLLSGSGATMPGGGS